jgi:hypothetical protein
LEACHGDLAVRHRQEGSFPSEVVSFPGSLLAEMEGREDAPVVLEAVTASKGRARWSDGAVPRAVEFDMAAVDTLPTLPDMPKDNRELPHGFLAALTEAARTTAKDSARFALARVQLRGRDEQVVATDGRQLLIQGGLSFPWVENVLVPRLAVFGQRDVMFDDPVHIGRARDVIVLEVGSWRFLLRIDKEARYPQIEQVIPPESAVTSRLCLDAEDASFLKATLPKLPSADEDHAPITLELATPPVVRAKGEADGQLTEVALMRSTVSGKHVRLNLDRRHLLRALKLGFTEVQVVAADTAIALRDALRVFVFVPLSPDGALPPDPQAVRVPSAEGDVGPHPLSPERTKPLMPVVPPNGNGNDADEHGRSSTPSNGIVDLIADAEALREVLHEAAGRTGRLVAALKHQRRQERAVRTAMASLRQLQLDQ